MQEHDLLFCSRLVVRQLIVGLLALAESDGGLHG